MSGDRKRLEVVTQDAAVGLSASKTNPTIPIANVSIPIQPLAYRKATVVQLIGVTGRTIDRLIGAGKFPRPDAYAGKAPLWRHATLESWLAQGGGRL